MAGVMGNSQQTSEILPDWNSHDAMCFTFDDKTGETRAQSDISAFIAEIRAVANQHGFDLSQLGSAPAFARFFHRYFTPEGDARDR